MRIRAEHKTGKYQMSKHEFYSAYHYALQYNEWKDRYDSIVGLKAVVNDGQPHGTAPGNPTENQAMQLEDILGKIKLVEGIVNEAAPDIARWLLKAVTNEGVSFNYLASVMNIPCGKKYYYNARRKFYYLLAKKIKVG